jgi:hypothetical protein
LQTVEKLLEALDRIWKDVDVGGLPEHAVALGVVSGDLLRGARSMQEGQPVDLHDVGVELGNLVLTSLRAMDRLDLDPGLCLRFALECQARYVRSRYPESACVHKDSRRD